jgi:hypothetical protein
LVEAYDRGGLPLERALTRLSQARWLLARGEPGQAESAAGVALALAREHAMRVTEADAWGLLRDSARGRGDAGAEDTAARAEQALRRQTGYFGPGRP